VAHRCLRAVVSAHCQSIESREVELVPKLASLRHFLLFMPYAKAFQIYWGVLTFTAAGGGGDKYRRPNSCCGRLVAAAIRVSRTELGKVLLIKAQAHVPSICSSEAR
jgi:hypothetical protein